MIQKESVIKKSGDVVMAELDGKIVMMSIENGEYYGFNEIASAVWEKIEDGIKFESLITRLTEEYSVTLEECEKDVAEVLEYLHSKNLIEIA